MNDFYVYVHKTLSERERGDVFYVGKGLGKRAWSKKGRNVYWKRIVAKYGYAVEIVADGLTESEAFEFEKLFIGNFGRDSLCNLTDGGEGSAGYVPTIEARMKISKANSGRTLTEIHKRRVSEAKLGTVVSEKTRRKIGEASKGRKKPKEVIERLSKPVSCSNGLKFPSLTSAVKWLNVNGWPKASKGTLGQACLRKRYLTAYGFEWSYDNA